MPKIKAKFRKRNGIPYAIEIFSGTQYRCRHCNEIFLHAKELDAHLRMVAKERKNKRFEPHRSTPALHSNVSSTVLYTYDIEDRMKKQWLKLKKNDTYDGL